MNASLPQFDQAQLKQWLELASRTERIFFPASRVIRSIGYFPPLQMLEVEQRGRNYRTVLQYFGVNPGLVQQFIVAPSKAAVFYQHVDGVFPKQEVDSGASTFRAPPWRNGEPSQVRDDNNQKMQAQLWGWK